MYYPWIGMYLYGRQVAVTAGRAEQAARKADEAIDRSRDLLERQALIIRALLEACTRKNLFTEEEFRDLVNEIDLSDGRLDGKYSPKAGPRECVECGKPNGKHALTCMYCGEDLPGRELM